MKEIGWGVGILISLVILGAVLSVAGMAFGWAWLPFYKFNAKLNYTQNTINTVYDAQRCINIDAEYQNLKTIVPAIRDEQIPNAEKALSNYEGKLPKDQTSWSVQQQQMEGELQTNITGLEQQLSSLQAEYSALEARPDAQPCLGTLPTFIDLK